MLSRLACSSLLVLAATSALHAQNNPFNRATPDVEAALRARITGFFEAQQQGKWRQAQEFVSEESIDAYLERDKNRYASFEIQNLRWVGEAYKEAVVTMIVPYDMMVPGVGTVATAPRPVTHHWRFEEGKWYWFVPKVDPCAPFDTPVGRITPECVNGKPVVASDPQGDAQKALLKMIESSSVDPSKLQGRVTANTSRVEFSMKSPGEQTIVITNAFDGPVTLELIGGKMYGLASAFEGAPAGTPTRITVEAKKTATLRFKFQPSDSRPLDRLSIQVRVDPLNVMLPVDILFVDK